MKRSLTLIALAALAAQACSAPEPWVFNAHNVDRVVDVGVRVTSDSEIRDWRLGANGVTTLIISMERVQGTVELFDLATCDVLDEVAIPVGPSVWATVTRGMADEPHWEISIQTDKASEPVSAQGTQARCESKKP